MISSSDDALRFALVAHDARKDEIVEWVGLQQTRLSGLHVFSTGTTGSRIKEAFPELNVTCLKSGPLGGDQQIGAMICEEKLDALIFFVDPLSPMPHDVDVKALTRLATVYDLPMACSRSTADLIVQGLIDEDADERV
ncbi:methylglyoxal synthase [Ruegeria hyattellae]|uniref:methylglyoxal synthase n=1 Tax=Ruegeria hyattellae TaxID=3233337 RepID=UPI00355AD4EC